MNVPAMASQGRYIATKMADGVPSVAVARPDAKKALPVPSPAPKQKTKGWKQQCSPAHPHVITAIARSCKLGPAGCRELISAIAPGMIKAFHLDGYE